MKAFGCIIISALALCILVPALGYEVQPLYGRTFNLFSLLSTPQALLSKLTMATSKLAILQAMVDLLSSQYTVLNTAVTQLQAKVLALQKPQCIPGAAAISARMVGDKCLSVEAGPKSYIDASNYCKSHGGKLAEPSHLDTNFYSNLVNVFGSTLLNSIPTGLYVGISGHFVGTVLLYTYNSDATVIPLASTIWTATPAAPATAALMSTVAFIPLPVTSNVWKLTGDVDLVPTAPINKGFLCEYPVF